MATVGRNRVALEVEAVYEHGTLKLAHAVPLQEGAKVKVTIHPAGGAADRLYGMLKWSGPQEDLNYLLGPDNHPRTLGE